jgi:prolyl 4-hydroxylase
MRNTDIPANWRTWLATNRARGCSEESMRAVMLKAGIDAASAEAWLAAPLPDESRIPQRNEIVLSDARARVALRVKDPDIVVLENFLSAAECDAMVALGKTRLKSATVVDPTSGEYVANQARRSESAMFQRGETPLVQSIERRIAELVNWPVDNAEGLQVLHYHPGGEYRPHYDYFPPDQPGSVAPMRTGGQRIATLIMYLNDVDDGGATTFPELGLELPPRKGSALWFSYCNASGQLDAKTLHGGAPVMAGEKWIATKWLRERRYG